MPELPEVETVRNTLKLLILNKRIVSVKDNRNNPLKVSMEKKIAKSDVDETP